MPSLLLCQGMTLRVQGTTAATLPLPRNATPALTHIESHHAHLPEPLVWNVQREGLVLSPTSASAATPEQLQIKERESLRGDPVTTIWCHVPRPSISDKHARLRALHMMQAKIKKIFPLQPSSATDTMTSSTLESRKRLLCTPNLSLLKRRPCLCPPTTRLVELSTQSATTLLYDPLRHHPRR